MEVDRELRRTIEDEALFWRRISFDMLAYFYPSLRQVKTCADGFLAANKCTREAQTMRTRFASWFVALE